jgi:hypothetical protein
MRVPDRWERWAPISGLVFAVSFLALFFLFFVPGELPAEADATQIADYYRGRGPAGFLLMYSLIGLAGAALLWFTGSLRASLRGMEPAPGGLSEAAFAGGVASATLLLAGGATLMAPFTLIFDSAHAIDSTLYNTLNAMAFLAINFGLFGQAVLVLATSIVALRWGGLPRWFALVGFVVPLALVLNLLYFFGLFVWVAWVLLASSLLLARPAGSAPLRARAAAPPPQPSDVAS